MGSGQRVQLLAGQGGIAHSVSVMRPPFRVENVAHFFRWPRPGEAGTAYRDDYV